MIRNGILLVILLLGAEPRALAAQEPRAEGRLLTFVSPQPGQEVWFAFSLDYSSAPAGSTGAVVATAQSMRVGNQLRLQTPAHVKINTDQPFQLTFATVKPSDALQLVVQPDSQRELRVTGNRIVLGRSQAGSKIEMRSPNNSEIRFVQPTGPR